MTLNEYQNEAKKTAIYPNQGKNIVYPTLGLAGEAGEVADKVGKIIRDKDYELDDETRVMLAKEVGDVLWFVSQLSWELGYTLEEIADMNIKKLRARKERGVISGSGDER